MDKIAAKAVRAYMDGLAWVYRWGGGQKARFGPRRCTPYALVCNLRFIDATQQHRHTAHTVIFMSAGDGLYMQYSLCFDLIPYRYYSLGPAALDFGPDDPGGNGGRHDGAPLGASWTW